MKATELVPMCAVRMEKKTVNSHLLCKTQITSAKEVTFPRLFFFRPSVWQLAGLSETRGGRTGRGVDIM